MSKSDDTSSTTPVSSASGLKIVLSTYDGSTDPKQWLRQLEKVQKAKTWTENQLITQAPLLLTGRGDEYWETIEDSVKDWKSFKQKFTDEFGERKTVGEHLQDLTTIKRDADEPLDVLMGGIRRKYAKAFPGADFCAEVHQKQLCARFVSALLTGTNKTDHLLGQHLQLHKADVTNTSTLVKEAGDIQPRLGASAVKPRAVQAVVADPQDKYQIDLSVLEDRIVKRVVNALQESNQEASKDPGPVSYTPKSRESQSAGPRLCYTCNSPEHIAKLCPYKMACKRCWQFKHRTRDCPAPHPTDCPLNSQRLGEKSANQK